MRKVLLYFALLGIASAVVFFAFFTLGRRPTLEQELLRRAGTTSPGPRELSIPSIQGPADGEGAGEETAPPEVVDAAGDVTLTRTPVREASLVLLLDDAAFAPGADGAPSRFLPGLETFLANLPEGVAAGVRLAAGGEAGECGETRLLLPPGRPSPDELRGALAAEAAPGPRSLGRGLEEAAGARAGAPGPAAVVVVTGGGEECGISPCQMAAAFHQGERPLRAFLVLLLPLPDPWEAAKPPPAWQAGLECLPARGGGALFRAFTAEALAASLDAIAGRVRSNLVVRVLHSREKEIFGTAAAGAAAWGVTLAPAGTPLRGGKTRLSFPAAFTIEPGSYDLKVWYRGREKTVRGVEVPPDRSVEVAANFRSGELYVEARNEAGEELVGETADFDCFWGVEAVRAGDATVRDRACSFPAYLVLSPGEYTIRAWRGAAAVTFENVQVAEGETTVQTATFPLQ